VNPRSGFLALIILVLTACSTSNNGSNSTNPLAGVTVIAGPSATPTVAPTATPAPTPTPAPNATPSPSPTPGNVLVDGGFEAEGAANTTFSSWTPCSYTHPVVGGTPIPAIMSGITDAVISASDPSFTVGKASAPTATVTPAPYTGTYAALTYTGTGAISVTFPPASAPAVAPSAYPNSGANGICQTFVVPSAATLTLEVNEGGYESKVAYGDQEATLFAGTIADLNTATPIPVFDELNTQYSTGYVASWVARGPYALNGAPYNLAAGTTATLFLGTFDTEPDSEYGEYMFVDNVSVFGTPVTTSSVRRSKR
jgi:hypothetical protein